MLACDGIWDCVSNDECCQRMNDLYEDHSKTNKNTNLHRLTEMLFNSIIAPNTDDGIGTDNMTAIIIYFVYE
jgi:serine/threonine protein phosphatase PrpC